MYLPPRGLQRNIYLGLWVLVAVLKVMAIWHYRIDSDEAQHAHVVWAWSQGQLQYRDLFDNHMPLFHMLCAPVFALLGEHAWVMIELRILMLPLFVLCLWAVYRLTKKLYSREIASWACLAAAALQPFFITSTEFRPDNLWALFWLLTLLVAVSGRFTVQRAFCVGLMLGLVIAVSLKTVALLFALTTATIITLLLARMWRRDFIACMAAIFCGALIAPGAIVLYLTWHYAFWIAEYCVINHNIVPGMKRWGHFAEHGLFFPLSLPVLGVYGWFIYRRTEDKALAMRRAIVSLTPWFYLCLLLSYCPDITREDDLPYAPLIPLSLLPLLPASRKLRTYGLPAVCFAELLCVWFLNPLRSNRVKGYTRAIGDVLLLTDRHDYVLDSKGDYIFRHRPDYWVFETLTRTRIQQGSIQDDLPAKLVKTRTTVCYLTAGRLMPKANLFIASNYLPVDNPDLDLGVAGKELGKASAGDAYSFDVTIPATYALVSESGATAGAIDGAPYTAPLALEAGQHVFQRTSGSGRAAIFLGRAQALGFCPFFDASESLIAHARDPKQ